MSVPSEIALVVDGRPPKDLADCALVAVYSFACDLSRRARIERIEGLSLNHGTMRGKAMGFAAFGGQKYLNLETFRKNGQGVKTPVWFACEPSRKLDSDDARLYVYTIGVSGKLKRIRNHPLVNVAPCDMRGGLKGPWVAARAEILAGAEAQHGMRLLNKKYAPWKQLLDFFALFRKRERTVFVIRPN